MTAQTPATATTKPVGYITQNLSPGGFNVVGLSIHQPVVASGKFETLSGTTLTDADVNFGSVLTQGKTYVLEIKSTNSAVDGIIQEVTAWNGNGITTQVDLPANFGLTLSDSYTIRAAYTIEEIFGTTATVLSKGPNAASSLSDIIWLSDGPGSFSRYYIRSSDSTVRNALTNAAAPNTAVVYTDGILVEKRNGSAALLVSGEVKTTSTVAVVSKGFNLLSVVYPAGTTLQNSGIAATIGKGPNAASTLSDVVWISTGLGSFDRYYMRSSDSTWRNAQTNAAAPADLPLSSSIYIEKKSEGSSNLKMTPPAYYSDL